MSTEQIDLSEAKCLACGYQLRGLVEHRCPECGRGFNPADPDTVKLPRRPKKPWWLGKFDRDMMTLAAAGTLFVYVDRSSLVPVGRTPAFYAYGMFLWLLVGVSCLVRAKAFRPPAELTDLRVDKAHPPILCGVGNS